MVHLVGRRSGLYILGICPLDDDINECNLNLKIGV